MKLKPVGFFDELRNGWETGLSLHNAVADKPQDNEERIVRYLRGGLPFVIGLGAATDVLAGSGELPGSLTIMTDGTWMWPGVLWHYVQNYHIRLPDAFVKHIQTNGWEVPEESKIDLEKLQM